MADGLSRELTPAQHQFIRQQLALIPLYVWIVYAWGVFVSHLPLPFAGGHAHVARDFVHFYTQGVIAREHDAHALYDIDAMAAVAARVVPDKVPVRFPPVYGPQVALLFRPLAALPYVPALLVWLAVTIAGFAACTFLTWRACPTLTSRRWHVLVLALGAPGLHFALSFGQASVLGLVCFTALWLALKARRPFLAGLAVGALAYKPQLGLVAACVFVLTGQWRIVGGAAAAVAAQAAGAVAYWGLPIFRGYVNALIKLPSVIDAMEPDKALMHSWRAFFLHVGVSPAVALTLSVALSIATIAVVVLSWRRPGDLAPKYVLLVIATLLVDPHIYAYDLLILTPALLVVWDWSNDLAANEQTLWQFSGLRHTFERGRLIAGLAAFAYAAPLVTIALPVLPVQWSVVAFLLLVTALASHVIGLRAPARAMSSGQ